MRLTPANLERVVLGEPARLTVAEVCKRLHASEADVVRIRTAAGLAALEDAEARFTEADVRALRTLRRLIERGEVSGDEALLLSRTLGRNVARNAEALAPMLVRLARGVPPAVARDRLDALEAVITQLWRRHLLAAATREAGAADGSTARELVVGFADMAQYTAVSRHLDMAALEDLVSTFEAVAAEVVVDGGGRIVKSLGDEILYLADDPLAGVGIALDLVDRTRRISELPDLHVGLAAGDVLHWQGDVYGDAVNVAARLTAVARAGGVVVDGAVADAVRGAPGITVRPLRRLHVTRARRWRPHVVQRSGPRASAALTAAVRREAAG